MTPPPYHHLFSNKAVGGSAQTTANVSAPANAWVVARVGCVVNSGFQVNCAPGTPVSGSLGASAIPTGAEVTLFHQWDVYDGKIRYFVMQAGAGGCVCPLVLSATGPDNILYAGWEIGYFDDADIDGGFAAFVNGVGDDFANDASAKSLPFGSTPVADSMLLSAWYTIATGGTSDFTVKGSPAWTLDQNESLFSGGVGSTLNTQHYAGSDASAGATPGAAFGPQIGVALEVLAAGAAPSTPRGTAAQYYQRLSHAF